MVKVQFDPDLSEDPKDQPVESNLTDSNKLNMTEYGLSFITFYFSRISFWYYFSIFILQLCVETPIYFVSTLIPMLFTFASSVAIYILQSVSKRKLNAETDKNKVIVRRNKQWVEILQKNIKSGDVIKLHNGDIAPCDVVLLGTGRNMQIAVNTRIIDGKNQLRSKKPIQTNTDMFQPSNILTTNFSMDYKRIPEDVFPPLTERVQFDGTLECREQTFQVSNEQFIEKFSIVYHTDDIIVGAVYTGSDCRCSLHSKTGYFRSTLLEKQLNRQNIIQILLIFFLSTVGAIVSMFYRKEAGDWASTTSMLPLQYYTRSFANFLVLLTPLSPLELYIMIDISLFIHSFFLKNATLSSVNRLDELTHIDSVVASKSLLLGTLPPTIKRIYVSGQMFGQSLTSQQLSESGSPNPENTVFDETFFPENTHDPFIGLFLEHIAVCHQATVQYDNNFISFISSIPAEEPLLRLAYKNGLTFMGRGKNNMIILNSTNLTDILMGTGFTQYPNTSDAFFSQVIYIPASKQHPRMSALIRNKGASLLFTRWSVGEEVSLDGLPIQILKDLQGQGLQVSIFSYKEISNNDLNFSGPDLIQKFAELEKTSTFLAMVGFEDPPRDGVLAFINRVRWSGIQIILPSQSGRSTLITHALSLGVLKKNQDPMILRGSTQLDVDAELERMSSNIGAFDDSLLVSGSQIQFIVASKVKNVIQLLKFFTVILIENCESNQVQDLVTYMRRSGKMTVIGIGQSISDSAYMTASSMSIAVTDDSPTPCGIVSDLTVERFDHLSEIIFVTCSWLYDRITTMINFTIPRDSFIAFMQLSYQLQAAFSGTPLFTGPLLLSILLFSGAPAVSRSVLNKRVDEYILRTSPQQRYLKQKKVVRLSFSRFAISTTLSLLGSIFTIWFKAIVDHDVRRPYNDTISLPQFRYSICATFILSCVAWTATQTDTWTLAHNIFLFGSLIIFFMGYGLVTDTQGTAPSSGVSSSMSTSIISTLSTFLFPIISVFLQFSYTLFKRFIEQERQDIRHNIPQETVELL